MLSDYSGVVYIHYNETGKWELDVVKELKACGFGVDANKLFSSSGLPCELRAEAI